MRGYKAFDKNLECRGKQYAIGGEYGEDGKPVICAHGMHFCERLVDVFDYYQFDEDETRVCEVEALGDVARGGDGSSKCCTNRLKVIRELDWNEILKLANSGTANTGRHNSGDHNNGDLNSGDWNSGWRNSGHRNSGWYNSGNGNSGDWNSGGYNSGRWNGGWYNSGRCNSGDRNSGDYNSGSRNSGWWNSGDANTGNHNSGNWNIGDWNSGCYNIGNRNSGDWNATDFSFGALCTEVPEFLIFDKPSGMTLAEWRKSHASHLLERVPIDASKWVYDFEMTDEEKAAHPGWEVTRGYLRKGTYKRDFTSWWAGLDDDERHVILSIPNFDPDKWERITGLHLHDEMPEVEGQESEDRIVTERGKALAAFFGGWTEDEISRAIEEVTGKALR